jgi:hypothetical protein
MVTDWATKPLVELASGVDSLYLSARAGLPSDEFARLLGAKWQAGVSGDLVEVDFGGTTFRVSAKGLHRYAIRLEDELGVVGVTDSERLPTFWIQARAEFVHAVGPKRVVAWYRGLLERECDGAALSVSRIDLHADWQGWELSASSRHRFLVRARSVVTYEEDLALSGFVFGRRGTGTVLGRVYDKTLEVRKNGHDWWYEIWGDLFTPGLPVVRLEFQIGREGLRAFELQSPEEVLEAVGDLWRYCTSEWLTYRTPSGDGTPSRWPIAPEWNEIQRASLRQAELGLARIRVGQIAGSLRTLMPGLNGYAVSFGALVGTLGVSDTVKKIERELTRFERQSGRSFSGRILERKNSAPEKYAR